MPDHKQSELGIERGSYAIVLLASPLVSLTISKFISVSEHCFVVALFSTFNVYHFRLSCPYITAHGQAISLPLCVGVYVGFQALNFIDLSVSLYD